MKNSEIGSFVVGIGATEDIDSSGEVIEIKGVDISSITRDGKIHFEHKNENSTQVIGKLVDCKKIMKESDCEHELHKKYWEKARKRPYIYVVGVLFDKMSHQGAQDALAQLKFDQAIDDKKTNGMGWWSIEGSRLGKEGNKIKKCIARDWAFTHRPCNKSCIAELLTDEQADKHVPSIAKKKVEDSMKKSLEEVTDLLKAEPRKYFKELGTKKEPKAKEYSKITPATGEHREGGEIEPKRTFTPENAPEKMGVGDRISGYKKQPKSGAALYRDPSNWKSEKKLDLENPLRKAIFKKSAKIEKSAYFKDDAPFADRNKKDLSHNLEPHLKEQGYTMHVSPNQTNHDINVMHNGKRVAGMTVVTDKQHPSFGDSLEYGSDRVDKDHGHNEDAIKRSYWRGALDHAADEGKNFHGRSWDHHQPIFRHLAKEGHKRMIGKRNAIWGTQFVYKPHDGGEAPVNKGIMKNEDKLEKAKVDEGKTPEEKAKARNERHVRTTPAVDAKDPKVAKYRKKNKIKQKDWQKDWMRQKTDQPGNKEYPRKGHNIRHIHQKGVHTGASPKDSRDTSFLGDYQEALRDKTSKKRNPFWDDDRHKEAAKRHIDRARQENKEIKPSLPKSEEMVKNEELKAIVDSKLSGWNVSHENKKNLHQNAKNIHKKTKNHSLSAELAVNDALESGHLSYKNNDGKEITGKRDPEKHGKTSKEFFSKSEKNEILKSLANEAWEVFKHKDLLIETIKKKEPELSENEVMGIAKTYAYIDMKKKESEIEDMFEKDEVKKAKTEKKEKPFHNYNPSKHSKEGGLNDKERKRINREEGSNLKRPVTGKVKAGSKAAGRKKSFCARMSGVKGPTSKEGKLTPKGAALKRWNCSKNEEQND